MRNADGKRKGWATEGRDGYVLEIGNGPITDETSRVEKYAEMRREIRTNLNRLLQLAQGSFSWSSSSLEMK